jgi:hypothetical protein
MAAKGWHTSIDMDYEVAGISPTRADLVLKRGPRVRRDGSPSEDVCTFHAWTKLRRPGRMFALSDIPLMR